MSSETCLKIVRPLLLTVLILGCFVTVFLMYFKPSINWFSIPVKSAGPTGQVEKTDKKIDKKTDKNLTNMLIWFWPFGEVFDFDWNVCSSRYNIDGCFLTADRKFYNKSDGVVIHHWDIHRDLSNLPKLQRPPLQKWIWWNLESPTISSKLPGIEKLFNLTLNYRQDADIPIPYGYMLPAEGEENFTPPKKDKLVCWIVSHWDPNFVRVKYFNELKKHVQIHTYGGAFGKRLPGNDFIPIMTSCKFYLSFENSIHKDYITEKLYNPLIVGTVPVVLGPTRQNYENFIQGDAFIHVDDFKSPKELADYLLLLDKNQEMYLRYFEWHRLFKPKCITTWTEQVCLACGYLRRNKKYKTFNHLDTWYWVESVFKDCVVIVLLLKAVLFFISLDCLG